MSMPRSGDHFFSQKRFARLPKIGAVQAVRQPRGSLDSASHHSAVSSNHDLRIEEGDLVTGIVDIAYERAHMMSAFRGQSKPSACIRFSLHCD